MEDNISNPLRFETNPYHNVIIKDRKVMELTGVKQIDSFDSSEFLLETAQGWMVIQGKDLTLGKLDTERGDVVIRGVIEALSYVSSKKGNGSLKDTSLSFAARAAPMRAPSINRYRPNSLQTSAICFNSSL